MGKGVLLESSLIKLIYHIFPPMNAPALFNLTISEPRHSFELGAHLRLFFLSAHDHNVLF